PPCPPAQPDERVPLASIRVSGNPCRVLSICNWTRHRKFATTFPSLQYWLGILPYGAALRDLLDRLCCFQIAEIFTPRGRDSTNTPGRPLDRSPDFFAAPRDGGEATAPDPGDFTTAQPPLYERATRRLNPAVTEPER